MRTSIIGLLVLALSTPVFADSFRVSGKSHDGKYPTYRQLDGEINDDSFYNDTDRSVWTLQQIRQHKMMGYVKPEDVNRNGYRCGTVCKDRRGWIVGLVPALY